MDSAVIYERVGRIIIQPNVQTALGWYIADEPVVVLSISVSANDLGNALIECMKKSKPIVPPPTDWKAFDKRHFQNLGVKSSKELHTNCKACSVSFSDGNFSLRPTRNTSKEFINIPNEELIVSGVEPDNVGLAIFETLKHSL